VVIDGVRQMRETKIVSSTASSLMNLSRLLFIDMASVCFLQEMRSLDVLNSSRRWPVQLRHVRALLAAEIARAWQALSTTLERFEVEEQQQVSCMPQEKISVPRSRPDCNMIGRLIGLRGISIKQLEQVSAYASLLESLFLGDGL
jgi:hypothetical protein